VRKKNSVFGGAQSRSVGPCGPKGKTRVHAHVAHLGVLNLGYKAKVIDYYSRGSINAEESARRRGGTAKAILLRKKNRETEKPGR